MNPFRATAEAINSNSMEILLSALERQIKMEKFRVDKREMMKQNPICFNEPLQDSHPQYLEELKKGYAI